MIRQLNEEHLKQFKDEDYKEIADELLHTVEKYRDSLSGFDENIHGFFTLHYQWADKKHRHVHDLCNLLENCAKLIAKSKLNKDDN